MCFYSKSASRLSAGRSASGQSSQGDLPAHQWRRDAPSWRVFLHPALITLNPDVHPKLFLLTWLAVLLLLGLIMILVFVDLRLTMKIRRGRSR